MKRLALTVAAAVVVVATTYVWAMIPEQVRIDSGLVSGAASGQPSVRVFKGIPFAAPPLAQNRWKAPQPVATWDGVRKADAFGAPCTSGPSAFGRGRAGRGRGGARGAAAPVAAKTASTSTSGRAPPPRTTAGR
jgi:hypothetical protein